MPIIEIENFLSRNGWTKIKRYPECNTFIKEGVNDICISTDKNRVGIDLPSINAYFVTNNQDCFYMGGHLVLGDEFLIEDKTAYGYKELRNVHHQ